MAGVGLTSHGADHATTVANVASQVYYVCGISVNWGISDRKEPVAVLVSQMSISKARQKAELYCQITRELARIRALYPEPDPADPQAFLAWVDRVADAKAQKLDGLYDRYFALSGQSQVILLPPGVVNAGDIMLDIPSQAVRVKAIKR